MDYVGIDLHKRESQICVLLSDGSVAEKRIQTSRERMLEFFSRFPKGTHVLIEASTESEWVARCIEELGHEVIIADPSFAPMYATRSKRVKTDRRDARALADACKSGTFRRSHRANDEDRLRKAILVTRTQMVRMRTRTISTVRALLRQQGIRVETCTAETFARKTRSLDLQPELTLLVSPMLALLDTLGTQIKDVEHKLEEIVANDPKVKHLTTVYGVGPITATAFCAVLGAPQRFDRSRKVGAYIGLTPGEDSSGDTRRRTSITKTGSTMLRTLLIQSAMTIMRVGAAKAPGLHAWATALAKRRNPMVARIALARKLASILFVMLRDGTPFDPTRGLPAEVTAA